MSKVDPATKELISKSEIKTGFASMSISTSSPAVFDFIRNKIPPDSGSPIDRVLLAPGLTHLSFWKINVLRVPYEELFLPALGAAAASWVLYEVARGPVT